MTLQVNRGGHSSPNKSMVTAMGLFHELQDIYYDALNLKEELDRIPLDCDCADAGSHVRGTCCCVIGNPMFLSEAERSSCRGCVYHLSQLRARLAELHSDRSNGISGSADREAQVAFMDLCGAIGSIEGSVARIEASLAEFEATCASSTLARLKAQARVLEQKIARFNAAI